MAVPEELLGQAVAMACAVGPGGSEEAGSFAVRLGDAAGGAWRGMDTAADLLLIEGINGVLDTMPELANSAVWATTTLAGECIASSMSDLVGTRVDWDRFASRAGLTWRDA